MHPPSVSDHFVDAPGGRLFVRRWRHSEIGLSRSDPPLLLLHESLGCVEQWRNFPARLAIACRREVIAYDRLGHGRASARPRPPALDFIAEEAATQFPALRDALQLERFALFGHSVGGGIALSIAAAHADRCTAVIAEAAQPFVETQTLDGIRAGSARLRRADAFARLAHYHGDKAQDVLDAWTGIWLSPHFRHWSLDSALARVHCPVLVIHGDQDDYGSLAFPRRIAERCAGPVTVEILSRCGHTPHRERNTDVLRLCADFLHRPPRRDGGEAGSG